MRRYRITVMIWNLTLDQSLQKASADKEAEMLVCLLVTYTIMYHVLDLVVDLSISHCISFQHLHKTT